MDGENLTATFAHEALSPNMALDVEWVVVNNLDFVDWVVINNLGFADTRRKYVHARWLSLSAGGWICGCL